MKSERARELLARCMRHAGRIPRAFQPVYSRHERIDPQGLTQDEQPDDTNRSLDVFVAEVP